VQQLATILSRAENGLKADPVQVEVHLAPGLPGLSIVGLPEAAVRESRDRVRAAIAHCGYQFPNRRITVNLAPADLPKEGGRFDLPIALGILAASAQIPAAALEKFEVLGELSLSGELRPVRGALPAALQCSKSGHSLIIPDANATEAGLVTGLPVYTANHLGALCAALLSASLECNPAAGLRPEETPGLDIADVRGQHQAKRALEIAAAGGHSLLMIGPPGSGKSMLAMRLPGLLPPMNDEEALEVAAIASIGHGGFDIRHWGRRPFRSPHHTASSVALVGGGTNPRPGEITLAHRGVLFLDELPEFDRDVLEALREPLETGQITISRAARQTDFPARFQLIAAMNPCFCGYYGDSQGRCRCTPDRIARYRGRLSGPLLDRLDLQIFVPRVEISALTAPADDRAETSEQVRSRVIKARHYQRERSGKSNAHLSPKEIGQHCAPSDEAIKLLEAATQRLGLSARAYHRVLKVARTIADLADAEQIGSAHVAEAIRFRQFDRESGAPAF
jgi:magnesium chelatase family protein